MSADLLLRQGVPEVYDLHIPELRRPFRAVLPCPERIYVAWHKDAEGVHDLLDQRGHNRYGHTPQDRYWRVEAYDRAVYEPGWNVAYYERVDRLPGTRAVKAAIDRALAR